MKQMRTIILCAFFCFEFFICIDSVFAFGRGEPETKNVEKMDSWREDFDFQEKKPGKYNIFARATDSGQNISIAGPYNIFIDPNSDKPIVGITNPVENMHVASNLNIVGTCVDDDAVQFVDIIIDGDEEHPHRAEGSEFWSYYLDTTGMEDGVHTITVYGTDIFNLPGDRKSVSFHLDRDTPVTSLQSHELGTLVSGKVKLAGIVSDGNGIKSLGYSIDGGETFEDIKVSYDKGQNLYTFDCEVDTLKMKDGPSVCWFKAVDKQGSIGIYTFLFFVDNTKPDVRIIYPALPQDKKKNERNAESSENPDELQSVSTLNKPFFFNSDGMMPLTVNGIFHATGYAGDVIGLQKLSWKFGKESGDFEIILGNPWWEKEFDVRNITDKSVPLEITAIDIAGNVTTCKQNIIIDHASDLPIVTITQPVADSVCFDTLNLSGFVKDDDAPAAIRYQLDGGEEVTVPLTGGFTVPLASISAGAHSVTVTPIDCYDVVGKTVTVPFTYAGDKPSVVVNSVVTGSDNSLAYADGIELHPEQKNILKVDLASVAGLKTWSFSLADSDPVSAALSGASKSVEVVIPNTIRYGFVPFTITVTDIYDRTVPFYGAVYMTNLSKTRVDLPVAASAFLESESFTSLTPSLTVTVAATGKKPAYEIASSIAVGSFSVAGVPFTNGMELTLPAASEKGSDGLSVTIETTSSIAALSYTMDGGSPIKLSAKKANEEGTQFTAVIPFPANTSADIHTFTVTADIKNGGTIGTAGLISVIRPVPSAGLADDESFSWTSHKSEENNVIFVGTEKQVSGVYIPKTLCTLVSATFDKNATGVSVAVRDNTVVASFDADGTYKCGKLTIKDSTGKTFRSDDVTFIVDSDNPVINWTSPDDQLWVQKSIKIKGTCSDSSGIKTLRYRVGEGDSWLPISSKGGRGNFSFDEKLDFSALPDGCVQVYLEAEDNCGKKTIATRVFNKDTVQPRIYTSVPIEGIAVNGENTISFFILDDGIIKSAAYGLFTGTKKPIEWKSLTSGKYLTCRVGTADYPLSENMRFRFIDNAGNETVQEIWPFIIDPESDLPVVEIHLPAENEVMRRDFVVSGVLYDDDKVSKVWYKIDNNAYKALDAENSFALPVELLSLTDNEHSITMYAEDIFGLKGKEFVRKFRVSLEEPKAEIVTPSFEETCRKIITISGTASDKNGIKQVFVSLDNGISFNRADGTEKWSYTFDSRVIQDGTHVVFIKVWDKYDTVALYSSLINTDNTAPEIAVTLPIDTEKISGDLFLSGHVNDNIKLEKLFVTIRSLSPRPVNVPSSLSHIELERTLVINKIVNVSTLPDGPYNIEFTGEDAAGNKVCASRNVVLDKTPEEESVNILYPLNGEFVQGEFNLYGNFVSKKTPEQLLLYIDGANVMTLVPSKTGYFNFNLTPELLASGSHELYVSALMPGGAIIKSTVRKLEYTAAGPWLTVDNFVMGDFAIERPWIEGRTGYALSEEDVVALNAKETPKEIKRAIENKVPELMEISFDNGKTFTQLDSAKKWRYRLQTQDMAQGYHFMVFRATMKNGDTAVTRSIARIDKTPPFIKLIAPAEGSIFNQNMIFSGLSSDDVYLESLDLVVRPGDKSAYEVPGFIQGLYFDAHFWGATLYDVGAGLSFFDDNVKLQFQFGQFTQDQRNMFIENPLRYGGNVFGIKLIANVAAVPFSYFLGPDWNWLSAAISIGANFSWFQQTQKGDGQILSAAIVQLEFPRVTFLKQKMFRTMSFYTEGQIWFIPTDIQGTAAAAIDAWQPQVSCGIRLNVF